MGDQCWAPTPILDKLSLWAPQVVVPPHLLCRGKCRMAARPAPWQGMRPARRRSRVPPGSQGWESPSPAGPASTATAGPATCSAIRQLRAFYTLTGDPAAEEWSPWSVCSTTCGEGWQTRTRFCVSYSYSTQCSGPLREQRQCNNSAVCPGDEPHPSFPLLPPTPDGRAVLGPACRADNTTTFCKASSSVLCPDVHLMQAVHDISHVFHLIRWPGLSSSDGLGPPSLTATILIQHLLRSL